MGKPVFRFLLFCIAAMLTVGSLTGCTVNNGSPKNARIEGKPKGPGKSIQENDDSPGGTEMDKAADNNDSKGIGGENSSGGSENSGMNDETDGSGNADQDNNRVPDETPKKKVKVRGLYLTGWTAGSSAHVEKYIELAKTTELNAYVVDVKDDDGYVGYESDIPAVREIGAWKVKYNADKVLKSFHDNNVHVIGRVVCFKDPMLSSKRADLAVKNAGGGLWKDDWDLTWLNPYNKNSWSYLIDIAKEAVNKGFDEIQFDYVRFPNDGDKKAMNFGTTEIKKDAIINEFLSYAREQMPGVILSADVFGIICESPADTEDIGQNLELIGKDIDYISPMVYPSHYALGQIVNGVKFAKPDLDPYGVVYNSLLKAKNRISATENYSADVRPFLQYFTASWLKKDYQKYGIEQVRQQIKAVYDAGYDEWILWDANNIYSEASLLK